MAKNRIKNKAGAGSRPNHNDTRASTSTGSSTGASTPVFRDLNTGKDDQSQLNTFEKRDSVISTTWEDSKYGTESEPAIDARSKHAPVRGRLWSAFRFRHWYPCRVLRWILDYTVGYRALQGPRGKDVFLTVCFLMACLFTCYTTLEFILVSIKGAAAQEIGQNTSCSVVCVTTPGPVMPDPITISFIDGTSSDSARETSYYSIISESSRTTTNVIAPNVPSMSTPESLGISIATSSSNVQPEDDQRTLTTSDMTGTNPFMPQATQNDGFTVELVDLPTRYPMSVPSTPTTMSSVPLNSPLDATIPPVISSLSKVQPHAKDALPPFFLVSTFSILAPDAANPTLSLPSSQSTRTSFTLPPSSRQSMKRSNSMSSTQSSGTWAGTTTLPNVMTPTTSATTAFNPSAPTMGSSPALNDVSKSMTAYENSPIVFVFPKPHITTTISYWTGVYPTVTGPEAWDLQSIPLTTRTIRQSPLSRLPSFERFTSTRSRFKTIVSTVTHQGEAPRETRMVVAEEPVLCGESGNFTLDFDDIVVGPKGANVIVANGMKNPYHHLFYANGYTNVPDKWEPFRAVSQPNVAMFLPLRGRLLANAPFAGTLLPGEIGAGPRASVSAYWFNAYSGFFGCALNGLTPCHLRVSGFRYDAVLKQEVVAAEQNVTIPACYGYIDCRLTQVAFNDDFRALSGIQFNAYTSVLGIPQVHMMDDLKLGWYNSSCAAGIMRIGHW
jgi:hypothetical protein